MPQRNILFPAAGGGGGLTNVNVSAGTTSNNLSNVVFADGNGVTFGLNGSTVTASVGAAGGGLTNINVSAGTTSNLLSAFTLSNSNGLAFGLNASTITGSYTVPTVTNSSWTASDNATSMTIGRLAFTNSNGLTMTLSTAGGGSATLIGSYTVPTVTNSSWTVSDNATSGTVARLAFTNLNGVTLSLSTGAGGSHTIVGSHNALTSQSTDYNAITLGGNTSGTTTFHATNNRTIFLNGGNNITLSGNGSTITISAAAQTNQSAIKGFGASNTGNTLGNTGISTGIDWVLAGTNALTVSESTVGGGPDTLWLSVPQTSSIVGTDGISISTNGSTISVSHIELSMWRNAVPDAITAAGAQQGNSLVSIQPFILANPIALSNILIAGSVNVATAANNSSAYVDVSASAVIYSRNVSTLSSVAKFSTSVTTTFSSNATNTVTGVQGLALTGAATTLTQGEYFLAVHVSTTNSTTGGAATTLLGNSVSMILGHSIGSAAHLVKVWGAQTANSLGLIPGLGILSTGATRATLAFSDYTMTGTSGFNAPIYFELRNQTWWG